MAHGASHQTRFDGDAELHAIGERLFEVEAEHLVVLGARATDLGGEPVRIALVLVGADLLQHPSVRGVADEHVMEAEEPLVDPPGAFGVDQ